MSYVVDPATWKQVVTREGCVVHADAAECEPPLDGHHVITQQQLRNRGLAHLMWDVRNGVGACQSAHRRHHSRREPIPLRRLPQHCFDFAAETGLVYLLERFYAGAKPW